MNSQGPQGMDGPTSPYTACVPLTAQEVFEHIQEEREYQNQNRKKWNHQGNPSIEAELLMMEEYLSQARSKWTSCSNNAAALDSLRKVVGIGFRCFENYGCPKRFLNEK